MLTEQQILKSVEVLAQTNAINVLWEDQILRDGEVISVSNFRRAYGAGQRVQFESDLGADASKYVELIDWNKEEPSVFDLK